MTEEEKEEEYKTTDSNNILSISLSSIIIYSVVIIFLWFALQTVFQILSHNIMRELEGEGGDDNNKLTNDELKILKEFLHK